MEWISVKEKKPEIYELSGKSELVLVYTLDGRIGIGHSYTQNSNHLFWAWENTMPIRNITHWMPLPKSPQS